MEPETHEGRALSYVLMKPDSLEQPAGYPLVILLHGFGASMYDLAGLAPAIDANGYVYAFPNAPYRVNFGMGQTGYSWATDRPNVEQPPPEMPGLEALLDVFLAEVLEQTGSEPGRVVLGGFSQGGGITLHYGLPRPETFVGLAVLSGFLRYADGLRERLPPNRDQRIFVAHGKYDQTIDIERGGRQTVKCLEAEGYAPVYKEYDMGHEISLAELRELTPWLHETLPPRRVTGNK